MRASALRGWLHDVHLASEKSGPVLSVDRASHVQCVGCDLPHLPCLRCSVGAPVPIVPLSTAVGASTAPGSVEITGGELVSNCLSRCPLLTAKVIIQ